MSERNAKVSLRLTPEARSAFLRAARLKGKSMQSVLAAYTAGFEKHVRKELENGKIKFE